MTRSSSQSFGLARFTRVLVTASLTLLAFVDSASAGGKNIRVKSGECIQAAIQKAACGDKIIVEAGTYAEQLFIQKDDISLVGRGAILVPPTPLTQNSCSGLAGNDTEAGICVFGYGVELAEFQQEHREVLSVARRVKGVSVTGFQVKGFGLNIAVVGAQDTRVSGNTLYDGGAYGILSTGSKGSRLNSNTVTTTGQRGFIAICNDDNSDVVVANNDLSGYAICLCVQTPGAEVRENNARNCCVGAFVDPGVKGAKVTRNHIGATGATCATDFPYGASGIAVNGAINSEVRNNLIEGQHEGGMSVGIALLDDFTKTPPAIASGNIFAKNILRDNDFDIFPNSTGSGNVFKANTCTTPAELCS